MQAIHEDTKRLKALLEGLEPEHMPELLTKSPEYFYRLGQEIAYYAKADGYNRTKA